MHKEENFEDTLDRELQELCGYTKGNSDDYDPETALFPKAITEVITDIRNAPPARRVKSRVGNVSGRYPSRKMGVTV